VGDSIRVVGDNVDATEAWNGPLFEIWMEYRDVVVDGVRGQGRRRWRATHPTQVTAFSTSVAGSAKRRVRLAALVGASGHAHGCDVAERMIETAIEEAAAAGIENVSFATRDVEVTKFDQTFDYAFSRMGTMFFANPVAALRNVRQALAPGGPLNMIVWRRKLDNEFMRRAEMVVAEYLEEPEEYDVARCGPGPFSMANADGLRCAETRGLRGHPARPTGFAVQNRQQPRAGGRVQPGARPRGRGATHVGRAGGRPPAEDR
jgi:SAM-dependent methyltransferase